MPLGVNPLRIELTLRVRPPKRYKLIQMQHWIHARHSSTCVGREHRYRIWPHSGSSRVRFPGPAPKICSWWIRFVPKTSHWKAKKKHILPDKSRTTRAAVFNSELLTWTSMILVSIVEADVSSTMRNGLVKPQLWTKLIGDPMLFQFLHHNIFN